MHNGAYLDHHSTNMSSLLTLIRFVVSLQPLQSRSSIFILEPLTQSIKGTFISCLTSNGASQSLGFALMPSIPSRIEAHDFVTDHTIVNAAQTQLRGDLSIWS